MSKKKHKLLYEKLLTKKRDTPNSNTTKNSDRSIKLNKLNPWSQQKDKTQFYLFTLISNGKLKLNDTGKMSHSHITIYK